MTHATPRIEYLVLFAAMLCPLLPQRAVRAQTEKEIAVLVEQVKAGRVVEVAGLLPALRKTHPDKAGVLYLEALLETNAERAVELYQRVADEYAQSAWADDALQRLYQYSYAVGAYRTARSYSERIAKEHPRPSPPKSRSAAAGKQRSVSASEDGGTERDTKTDRVPEGTALAGSTAPGASYAVQVGAFRRAADARMQMDDLKTKGYTAYLREKTVKGKTYQAVWLGVFPDSAQAQAFARKLKSQQNLDAIVVRR